MTNIWKNAIEPLALYGLIQLLFGQPILNVVYELGHKLVNWPLSGFNWKRFPRTEPLEVRVEQRINAS